MQPEDRDPAYLLDMLLACRHATEYLARLDISPERPELVLDALQRHLITLGEAARRVSREFKDLHPEIPWQDSVGMRNVLVHDYGRVDEKKVLRTVRDDLPTLARRLDRLVRPPA